jgi:hypothetical protein
LGQHGALDLQHSHPLLQMSSMPAMSICCMQEIQLAPGQVS